MDNDIKTLLEQFMAGQTSIKEEDRLARYFRTHDVGDEYREYKEMFAWFDQGMPIGGQAGSEAVGQSAEPQAAQRRQRRRSSRKTLAVLVAAAAAIALLMIMAWPTGGQRQPVGGMANAVMPGHGGPAAKPDTLAADTATTVMPKKKTPRRGLRPGRYEPAPPKEYMADAAQDTARNEAELIAERKIRQAEQQQEKTLDSFYNEYKRIEAGIELYVTACENYDIEEDFY